MTSPAPLSDRARGWLRFLWEKTTTVDDWSSAGEPHPWWDRDSTAPMCAFPRYDLMETSCVLPLMADATPAWREVYTRIADELAQRYTSFWCAVDWHTLIGADPNRDRYPPQWQIYLPERLRGRYDSPGWTANGIEPWGLQPDPVGADSALFHRGFFNFVLSVYRYVAGDDKWEQPFPVTGYLDRQFEWTHTRIAEFLALQMGERPQGPHCENTKIWPFCVSAAGLGLKFYDTLHGSAHHSVYHRWIEFAKKHYMGLTRHGELDWFALYYDPLRKILTPLIDHVSGYAALITIPYIYPVDRELGQLLYELTMRRLGWSDPRKPVLQLTRDPRHVAQALFLARELGDDVTEQRLRTVAERDFQPRTFGAEQDRFAYWFGLDSPWPRGQLNALMALSEVGGPGAWWRVFNQPNLAKHDQPTVTGVDYPTLGISQAYYQSNTRTLWVRTYAATPSRRRTPTTWRVAHLPNPAEVQVHCDGHDFPAVKVTDDHTIEITSGVGDHLFGIQLSPHAQHSHASARPPTVPAAVTTPLESPGTVTPTAACLYLPTSPTSRSCCSR